MSDERDDGPQDTAGEDEAAMDADGLVEDVGDDGFEEDDEAFAEGGPDGEPAVSAKPPPLPPKKKGPSKGVLIGGSLAVVVVGVGLAWFASELLVSKAAPPPAEQTAGAQDEGADETAETEDEADPEAQRAADEAEAASAEDREPVRLEALVVGADGGTDAGGP